MVITKGTTPTINLTVTDFEIQDTDEIHLYFSQRDRMIFKKVTPDVIINGNTVSTILTQEDTFKLKKGEVKMQFRLKSPSGTIMASSEVYAEVKDVDDDDEVI